MPWIQPWDGAAGLGLPRNAVTGRRYSGINILILWDALSEHGFASQRWLTYRQAQALGGNVRKGEQGVTVCYADRFTPRDNDAGEGAPGGGEQRRQVAFLKRFTVFNVEQCEALPVELQRDPLELCRECKPIPQAEALIAATGADVRIGGDQAFYVPSEDYIRVPPQQAYPEPVNWYRTALHELGHWTGHHSRLDRFERGMDREAYGREELVAEMCSAFLCAELGIYPSVRHADYIGCWLDILREDARAIFRAASKASKAADYLLAYPHSNPPWNRAFNPRRGQHHDEPYCRSGHEDQPDEQASQEQRSHAAKAGLDHCTRQLIARPRSAVLPALWVHDLGIPTVMNLAGAAANRCESRTHVLRPFVMHRTHGCCAEECRYYSVLSRFLSDDMSS